MTEKVILVGNPNVGKTTLFNLLTGSFEHTGNWHGVTVDKKEKRVSHLGKNFDIIDLPGLYSLSGFSFDEQVAIDYLFKNRGTIVNVVDANVIERNLCLTLGLIEMGLSPCLFVNFVREVKEKGNVYDFKKLSRILNLRVFTDDKNSKNLLENLQVTREEKNSRGSILSQREVCSFDDKSGCVATSLNLQGTCSFDDQSGCVADWLGLVDGDAVNAFCPAEGKRQPRLGASKSCSLSPDGATPEPPEPVVKLPYLSKLPLAEIKEILSPAQLKIFTAHEDFIFIKILEQDEHITKGLNLTEIQQKKIDRLLSREDFLTKISALRYEYIAKIMKEITIKKSDAVYGKHKIDKIVLNKFLCLPIFFFIMFAIFFLTFSSIGAFLSEGLKALFDLLSLPIKDLLIAINSPKWVVELFSTGIVSGVGGLLSFIPQIVLLFLFLSLLEDSGYMSRLAFSLEEIFYKFGLSGKSIFTILMSFGCSTTAVMTARNIEDKNTKLKTAMLTPYMSCSAKLPIYAVIGGAFFGKGNILLIILMYVLGLLVALIVATFLNHSLLKSGERSFILEFPPYRLPSFRRIYTVIWQNCKAFVLKVATLLLSFSVIVWILQNFTFSFAYVPNASSEMSMLETIGRFFSVIFAPIGLGNYGIVISLVVGVMAKEMVVATMAIINKIPNTNNFNDQLGYSFFSGNSVICFTPITAVVMMVFSLLYLPCVSTIAVLRQEIGVKWTLFACFLQFSIAYVLCFLIFNFATGTLFARLFIGFFVLFSTALLLIFSRKFLKKKSFCPYARRDCNKCFSPNN